MVVHLPGETPEGTACGQPKRAGDRITIAWRRHTCLACESPTAQRLFLAFAHKGHDKPERSE